MFLYAAMVKILNMISLPKNIFQAQSLRRRNTTILLIKKSWNVAYATTKMRTYMSSSLIILRIVVICRVADVQEVK